MLKFPANLSDAEFLSACWQKQPLFMPAALERLRPNLSRNELAWLATLDDVESRLVFVERHNRRTRYRAETGPFDSDYLHSLPPRDWTLLVHDVEKHLPQMRALFACVPFIPDWRIDDLMVSFAAPGGGVGPHRDHYDVFLCQGIGIRNWRYTSATVALDNDASRELSLLQPFDGDASHDTTAGDVLYIPPGVAHWGTAVRACMTYSIGMRAPQVTDLVRSRTATTAKLDGYYRDTDLAPDEARPGYISRDALRRVADLLGETDEAANRDALGRFVTLTKQWLTPDTLTDEQVDDAIAAVREGARLKLHGMTRIAYDDAQIYLNGTSKPLSGDHSALAASLCQQRGLTKRQLRQLLSDNDGLQLLRWLLARGGFDVAPRGDP